MHPDVVSILYSEEEIAQRVKELGAQITEDYRGEKIVLVTILKGGCMFLADLARHIDGDVEFDFMAVSSYGAEAKSSGVVRIIKDLDKDIHDANIIVIEDIIDSGFTMKFLMKYLRSRGPKSVEVASLLRRHAEKQIPVDLRYTGFECEEGFLVGYGLDYAGCYRQLPYIAILDPKVYE
jgi:hypoxanthine phosphoribosyltransferase